MTSAIGRWIISLIDTGLRLVTLGFVWGVMTLALGYLTFGTRSGFMLFLALFVMIPVAFFVSHFVLQKKFIQYEVSQPQSRPAADSLSARDLIALLDDDDLDGLRGEIRESLRARIQRLSGEDIDSFEELLADAGAKRKRGGR